MNMLKAIAYSVFFWAFYNGLAMLIILNDGYHGNDGILTRYSIEILRR